MDLDQLENKIIVSLMEDNDIEKCHKLYLKCFNKQKEIPKSFPNNKIYVARINDEIVGMIQVDYINLIFENETVAFINSVCVSPDFQRQGIGKVMLSKVLDICKNDGCTKSLLTSNNKKLAAHKLYESLGYKKYDTNVFVKRM